MLVDEAIEATAAGMGERVPSIGSALAHRVGLVVGNKCIRRRRTIIERSSELIMRLLHI
jgi:hypothetical protein